IYSYGSVPVFYRSTIIDIASAAGRDDSMLLYVNKLDTSNIKSAGDAWDIEKLKGEPLDIPVNMSWAKIYYTKHEDGSYYDYIQKETVTRYTYVRHEDFIESFTMTSKNGVIELANLNEKLDDENAYYVLSYNYNDQNGYYCYDSRSWGYTYFNYPYDSYYRNFSFMNMNEAADNIFYYSNFTDNEDISLQLQENSQPVSSGRYIAIQKGDAFGEYSLNNADVPYLSEFNEDLIPNYVVTGLYFDGKHIYPIDNFNFWYDSSERKLQLEIETDKESYAAGEDITVTVTVKDKDGNAAANTDVLLSLVDEAAFAVEDQYVNILDGIYSQRYRNYVESYGSHIQHNLDGDEPGTAEEGGEGGADYIRSDFVDTAFFATLLTDENGKAEFSFSMPDNLTTWRITAQGFNEAMHAGDKVSQTIVTQEFFINPVFSDVYLAGDEAYISLRCFGTSVTGEENVKYSVILTKDGIEQNFAAEGMAGEYTFLKLGRLEAGSYTLTMKAESGELGDAIQKTIECIASGISTNISESFDLAEGINITPEKYPVLLSFSNGSFKEYNEVLGWLLSNSNNTRADQALTRAFVLDQLGAADYFGDIDTSWIQPDYTGGLMLFDTDNHSIFFDNQLSALAALAVPEYLNQTTLTDYLYSIVDDYDSAAADIAAAYMGLAALGEPVLLDIRYMLAGDWFEYDEALYLLLGLALLGDEENTESLYETMISARMQIEQNAITGDMAWLSNEKADAYETQFRTAFALAIATAAGKDTDAAMFAEYLQQIKPDRYLYLLQMVYYAKNIEPAESAPAAFSFMQDGERKVIELGMTDKTAFWFSKEQLEKADFKVLSGDVYCTAFYEGSAALLDEPARELVKLEKNITTVKGDGGPGTVYLVTVSVKFDKTAPYGGYTVEDYIPSGCRFLKVERYVNDNWYCIDQGLQGITFYYPYPDPAEGLSIYGNSSNGTTTIRYYIRSLLPGDYVSDSAVISHSESGAWGKSAKGMLTIGE
ncbi:MAG: hypothetical protein IJP33_02430, partial [Firmicutes bacterium]|nr:hypothetical protein [Bacillota bacterium]